MDYEDHAFSSAFRQAWCVNGGYVYRYWGKDKLGRRTEQHWDCFFDTCLYRGWRYPESWRPGWNTDGGGPRFSRAGDYHPYSSSGVAEDYACSCGGGGSVSVLRNDYNRDGNSDIIAVYNDYLYIWFGTGQGGFTTGGPIGSGWTPYASTLTAVGDINGDGNGDLVAVYNDYLHKWYGTGQGGFTYAGVTGSGWTPYASTLTGVGDINGDGNGDLVAVLNDYIYTWFGSGQGGFHTGGPIGSGWTPYASTLVGMGDINHDGTGDLLAISNDYLYRWYGTGEGGFTTQGFTGAGWTIYAPIH